METNIGRIWTIILALSLVAVILFFGDTLVSISTTGEAPFLTALTQLGILYIVALFIERSLEVIIRAWRQGGKSSLEEKERIAPDDAARTEASAALQEYKVGTQRRALLVGLTLGAMVSLSGVRLLGPIFDAANFSGGFQSGIFQFTDIVITAGLIAGGSKTIHEIMALVDDFLRASRKRAKNN